MHRSRLSTLVIDCEVDDIQSAIDFWSAALGGSPKRRFEHPGDENFALLETHSGDPKILLQKVSHSSRVHVDIETDDIEAEVARLEKLGAKRVRNMRDWCVMQAPTGHRYCVVRAHSQQFDTNANKWI